jgi:biotin operon repressor
MNIFSDLFLLQRVDHLVRTRATGSPKSLASLLKVSECSVYRLIDRLRNMGLPIAYDKQARTYYYEEQVKWNVEFVVGNERVLNIRGGEKISDNFLKLAINDSTGPDLCSTSPNYGAQ